MPTINFIYDDDCPNVDAARTNLAKALASSGLPARWQEHRIGDETVPKRVRGFGSPTILVNGADIAGSAPSAEVCCRIYDASGGVPSTELIERGLEAAQPDGGPPASQPPRPWRVLAAVSGVGAALLPTVACPACWPAYAGVLSALGVGALMSETWVVPITVVGLAVAVGALGFRAQRRRGYRPLALGIVAAAAVLAGKFVVASSVLVYAGVALLIGASVWNAWPAQPESCAGCATTAAATPHG